MNKITEFLKKTWNFIKNKKSDKNPVENVIVISEPEIIAISEKIIVNDKKTVKKSAIPAKKVVVKKIIKKTK